MIEVYYYDILKELPIIGNANSPHTSHYYFTTKDKDNNLGAHILVRDNESKKYRFFNKWRVLYKKTKFSSTINIPVTMYINPNPIRFKKPNLNWIGVYKGGIFYKSPNYNGPEELVEFVVNYLKGDENTTL